MSDQELAQTEDRQVPVNIDAWLGQRDEFIQKVSGKMVEKKDYHVIQGKKSLAKGGAEKIASIFNWKAGFKKDQETLDMLNGEAKGTLAYVCTLTNGGEFVGEGRGARNVKSDGDDINKSVKMAQKSAYIDAIIRASGLSDIFTQDLEDMPSEAISNGNNAPASGDSITDKQLKYLRSLIQESGESPEETQERISGLVGRDIASAAVLKKSEAKKVIDSYLGNKEKEVGYDGKKLECEVCSNWVSAGVKSWSQRTYGRVYCMKCQEQRKNEYPDDIPTNEEPVSVERIPYEETN